MNKLFFLPAFGILASCYVTPAQSAPTQVQIESNTPASAKAMTQSQIAVLLSEERHVSNQQTIVDGEFLRSGLSKKPRELPKEYPLIAQQLTAIQDAGKLQAKELIPNLVSYLDYVALKSATGVSIIDSDWMRRRYPARDAIMKIDNIESVVDYVNGDYSVEKRANAFSVLRSMDTEKAIFIGNQLLQDPKFQENPKVIEQIQSLVDSASNEKEKSSSKMQ